jgi:hypothetical protein
MEASLDACRWLFGCEFDVWVSARPTQLCSEITPGLQQNKRALPRMAEILRSRLSATSLIVLMTPGAAPCAV